MNGTVWRIWTFSTVSLRTVDPNVVLFCVSTDTTSRTHPSLTAVMRSKVYWLSLMGASRAGTVTRRDSSPTWSIRPGNVYFTIHHFDLPGADKVTAVTKARRLTASRFNSQPPTESTEQHQHGGTRSRSRVHREI